MTPADDDPRPPRDPAPEPPPAPVDPGPLAAILWFLEECRLRGFRVGPVIEHGGTRLQVVDLRQAKMEGMGAMVPAPGIWEENGFKEE